MSANRMPNNEIVEESTKGEKKDSDKKISSSAAAFARLGINNVNSQPEISPLEKHVAYFADEEGNITHSSMKEKFMQLGDNPIEASGKAFKVMALGGAYIRHCPFSMFKAHEAIGALNHARDTGIYQTDGGFNKERWEKLCEYSEMDAGKAIITKSKFYEFLQWCRDNDPRWDVLGIGKTASNAEWDDYFKKLTDHWKKDGNNNYEASSTLDQLQQFYLDSPTAFDKVVNHELPTPRPF